MCGGSGRSLIVIAARADRAWIDGRWRTAMGWTADRRRQSTQEEPMPTVTVLQGPRTVEQKRDLIRSITDAFVDSLGLPAESVQVWIQETQPESWGVGGKLTADSR
jgi:4-oxalocrotonate tautomerase